MALNPNELRTTAPGIGSGLRVYSTSTQPKTFAQGSGTLAKATPVAKHTTTGHWHVWDNGGANGLNVIGGFVWSDDIALDSDEEVIGNVMMSGRIHYGDIVLPAGEMESDLKTALSAAREKGFIIEGLEGWG